ncbi:MAG: 2-amino-4-hydroxy-6-hydroxymethyldihydropteridine diphosphokinase [Desulfobacteraceae bacterium]|nr:2-amino-4-hydroxy-6-hydroxymethyldihydropteridine diphosphokinase [Desulfobacteraceae bacterium]
MPRETHIAYISAGSNIGKRRDNCRRGFEALDNSEGVSVRRISRYYRTEPQDYTDQEWFANAVACVETRLEPLQLLAILQAIQRRFGRDKDAFRFGPRILDLDILLFDDRTLCTDALEIPHPRMHKRRFVLQPICDIDPNIVHPSLHQTMSQLLQNVSEEGQTLVPYP